jgi:hypothetical protein
MIEPATTYLLLLIVQALHLLHHRLAKRHISFAEVASAGVLCIPLTTPVPGWLFCCAHLTLVAVQVIGSVWIQRLSPDWAPGEPAPRA